jgi:branched-chain amino acid aminotransferase group I
MESITDRDGWIWQDGALLPWREARLHVLSHGLHYASTVFEGARAYAGRVFALTAHHERLHASAAHLGFTLPFDVATLNAAAVEVLAANDITDGYLRPIAWCDSDSLSITGGGRAHVAIAAWPWPSVFAPGAREAGITLGTSRWRRPMPGTAPWQAKASGVYEIGTLARREAEAAGFDDALLLSHAGDVGEATGANLFLVIDGELHTPVCDGFLAGITRQAVLDLAAGLGIAAHERRIAPAELDRADEVFLTGTAYEVQPVRRVDDHEFTPGPVTRALMSAYDRLVRTAAPEETVDHAVRLLNDRVIPLVDRFRRHQVRNGSIPEPGPEHRAAAEEIARVGGEVLDELGLGHQADALRADIAGWLEAGLETKPEFDRTRDAIVPPEDGGLLVFIGPVLMTNSQPPVRHGFEAFVVRRQEPRHLAALSEAYPHPKNVCQSTILLTGSEGASTGNCLVFFPENIPARQKPDRQLFAVFLFSKFRRIHETFAIPAARAALAPDSMITSSEGLSPEDCYEARAVWGYLHDYFHHRGPRPFDEHIAVKLNWFVGLLEEVKVDCQTILTCVDAKLPLADEQVAMVLLERIFRYPLEERPERVFDSGTGVLLYSRLRERGVITRTGDGRLRMSLSEAYPALRDLVDEILTIEHTFVDDDVYRAEAKSFVRRYLPEGAEGDKYAFTEDQEILRAYRPDVPALTFGVAEL